MDIEEAIIREQYALMYANSELVNLMGATRTDEWLFDSWARAKDANFPYIIQTVELNGDPDLWAMQDGFYTLDLWDYGPKSDRILAIRHAIMKIQTKIIYDTLGGDARSVRWFYRRTRSLPDDDPLIYHRRIEYDFRLFAQSEVDGVITR